MNEPNPPHNRQRAREKAQQKRHVEATIEARKQAWSENHLTHDPRLVAQRLPNRSIAEQNAHRIDAHREAPRDGLMWRGKPWWKVRLWPLRAAMLLLLARIIYGVVSNILARDAAAIIWMFAIPFPVAILIATFANKKVD